MAEPEGEGGVTSVGPPSAAIDMELASAGLREEEPAPRGFTRPSLRLGLQLSMRKKRRARNEREEVDGRFQRNTAASSSLPQNYRRSGESGPGRMRRASSLQQISSYDRWEELTVTFGSLRQSSRRLEDRIAQQYVMPISSHFPPASTSLLPSSTVVRRCATSRTTHGGMSGDTSRMW